jgi:hypothetical protein
MGLGRRSAHMLTVVAAFAVLLGSSVATAASTVPSARAAAAACRAKKTRVGGHSAYVFCGPATARVSVGGSTYRFSGGTCIRMGSTLIVSLGETVNGDVQHNGGKTYLSLDIARDSGDLYAYSHGHSLFKGPLTLAVIPHGPSRSGAFHGKDALTGVPFTGSWNCH